MKVLFHLTFKMTLIQGQLVRLCESLGGSVAELDSGHDTWYD